MISKSIVSVSAIALVLALAGPAGAAAHKTQAKTPAAAAKAPDPSSVLSPDAVADQALEIMKKTRLVKVLSDNVPEFDGLMRSRIRTIVATMPQTEWADQARMQSQALVQYYFAVYMPMASDESIYALMKYDTDNLALYAGQPEVCIGYAVGNAAFIKVAPAGYIEKVSDLKAAIFESAFKAPVHRDFKPDLSDVRTPFIAQYQKEGFDMKDLSLLGSLTTIPAADACRAYSQFNKTIYDLGPKQGPFVMAGFTNAAPKVKPN